MYALVFVGLTVPAAVQPKDAPAAAQLEGDWVLEKYVDGGVEQERRKGARFLIADGKIAITTPSGGKEPTVGYTVDAKANPPRIDLTSPDKKEAGPIPGIYRLDGDTLKICFPKGRTKERPAKFESPADSRIVLMTLKRPK